MALDHYDRVLVGMGGCLGLGLSVGALPFVALRDGLLAGSLFATLFIYDGLFKNPPTEPRRRAEYGAVVWHVYLLRLVELTL